MDLRLWAKNPLLGKDLRVAGGKHAFWDVAEGRKAKLCGETRRRWNGREGLFLREAFQDFGGVAFGFDDGPGIFYLAGFADKERAADDAHEGAAHELFLLPGAEFFDGFVIGIAEQREIQLPLFLKGGKRLDGIRAHAEDGHSELVELRFCVTKLGRFDGSTGSVGLGEEKEEDATALEIFQRDFFAFVRLETEIGGFGTYFEHPCTSISEVRRARKTSGLKA